MKINKNLISFFLFVLFAFSSTFVLAKNEKSGSTTPPKITPVNAKYLKQTIEKIETVKPKIKTPAVKQEIEVIQEEQIVSDKKIDESLSKISTRSGLAKLVIGPDYKNAGAVRSEIVHLQNQVRQLTRLETKASTSEKPIIKDSINSLNQELITIQTRLNDSLKGFSLFGWLNKLLTGFVPAAPAVTITPTVTPNLSTTPTLSPTTIPTLIPTLNPTVTP